MQAFGRRTAISVSGHIEANGVGLAWHGRHLLTDCTRRYTIEIDTACGTIVFPIGTDHIHGSAFHFPSTERRPCTHGLKVVCDACIGKVAIGNEVGCVTVTVVADQDVVSISTVEFIVSTTADKRVIVDCDKTDVVERSAIAIRASDFNESQCIGSIA